VSLGGGGVIDRRWQMIRTNLAERRLDLHCHALVTPRARTRIGPAMVNELVYAMATPRPTPTFVSS